MQEKLNLYLATLVKHRGSDLHIKAGAIARGRIDGGLRPMGNEKLGANEVRSMLSSILTQDELEKFDAQKGLDFTYLMDRQNRFRVNAFLQIDGISMVFRHIPTQIPELGSLDLPEVVEEFVEMKRGLVLVTGVTGSGKSTTLAAIIDAINRKYNKHIITIEDPVEFVHSDKESLINQRSVGQSTHSFADALKGALREDPDIILVGEMRDLETIDIALHAANTGHLVFSTLHTLDAKETIDRIVGMFGEAEQNRIRISLGSVLEGVLSQRLVERKGGGRVAAIEVLKKTRYIEELIYSGQDSQITDALEEGHEIYKTQSFDLALVKLYEAGKITREIAIDSATSPSDMKLRLDNIDELNGTKGKEEEAEEVLGFKE